DTQKNPQTAPIQVMNVSTRQGLTVASQSMTPSTPMRPDYTREPGVMLFRQTHGGGGKLLLLFLVGETPTSGIHKAAFLNALDQIQRLLRDVPLKIRVLGPTFSGTAASLALSLRHWLQLNN